VEKTNFDGIAEGPTLFKATVKIIPAVLPGRTFPPVSDVPATHAAPFFKQERVCKEMARRHGSCYLSK